MFDIQKVDQAHGVQLSPLYSKQKSTNVNFTYLIFKDLTCANDCNTHTVKRTVAIGEIADFSKNMNTIIFTLT